MAQKSDNKNLERLEKKALRGIKNALKKSRKTEENRRILSAVEDALENGCKTVRPDVAALRRKLSMTQKEFAEAFHLNLETLRNWEQGNRAPDTTAIAYLTCIEKQPEIIARVLGG